MKRMVIAGLFVVMGAITVYMAFHVSSAIRRGRSWPTTPGKILERRVGEPMKSSNRNFLPYVRYSYTVGGKSYENDQVYTIRGTGGLHDTIQELVDGLPDPVPVHYNPDQPGEAYLVTNPMTTFWIMLGLGSLGLIVGLLQLLVVVTRTKGSA